MKKLTILLVLVSAIPFALAEGPVGPGFIQLMGSFFGLTGGYGTAALTVSKPFQCSQNAAVNGTLFANGNETIAGTLSETGAATFNSTLQVIGNAAVNGTLAANGNETIAGTLSETGAATFNSTLTVLGQITGNGAGLTNLNAAKLAGTIDPTNLPANALTNTQTTAVTIKNVLTVSNIFFPTNTASLAADMNGHEGKLIVTSAITLLNPVNVPTTAYATYIYHLTNNSGAPVLISLPNWWRTNSPAGWNLTNTCLVTENTAPGEETNAVITLQR